MNKINGKHNNKFNYLKKLSHNSPKKEDLCKKYFYRLNLSPKISNIFQLMESGLSNHDDLEQVDNICTKALNKKNELEKKKIDCLKSMILHHKQIPEKWIIKSNYKDLLNKVMSDSIVLSYAIVSKDIYKKRSTSLQIDISDSEKYLETSSTEPKFISYINPYSRNYADSLRKHKLMRDYCYNIKNKKNRKLENIIKQRNNNNLKNNIYLKTEAPKKNIFPCIYPNIKDSNSQDKDIKEDFMMTSLYYDENNITKDKNDKINKEKENDKENNELNSEENNNSNNKNLELPLII